MFNEKAFPAQLLTGSDIPAIAGGGSFERFLKQIKNPVLKWQYIVQLCRKIIIQAAVDVIRDHVPDNPSAPLYSNCRVPQLMSVLLTEFMSASWTFSVFIETGLLLQTDAGVIQSKFPASAIVYSSSRPTCSNRDIFHGCAPVTGPRSGEQRFCRIPAAAFSLLVMFNRKGDRIAQNRDGDNNSFGTQNLPGYRGWRGQQSPAGQDNRHQVRSGTGKKA